MTQLLKVHGSHNQFFLLDQTTLDHPLTDRDLHQLGIALTHPQTGLLNGADGLLVVEAAPHPGVIGAMRVINADGSEASMCGNGLRAVGRYLAEKTGQRQFKVATPQADLAVAVQPDFAPNVAAMAVEISPVRYQATAFPFQHLGSDVIRNRPLPQIAPDLLFTAIAVPNPHLISFVTDRELSDAYMGPIGTRLNGDNPYFPDGVNVNFAKIMGPNTLFVRTFERGVGFTNACGTGMSATSLAFALTHPDMVDVTAPLKIYNPGGMVQTRLHLDGPTPWIQLIGNATVTHHITLAETALRSGQFSDAHIQSTGEETAYTAFTQSLDKNAEIPVFE